MIEEAYLNECPKFHLLLKSHSQKKRICEAKQRLECIYPFNVKEENLFIKKTEQKGYYDVFITSKNIEIKHNIQKFIIFIPILVFFILILAVSLQNISNKKNKISIAQKELERIENEKIKIQKEKETKLYSLKNEYYEILKNTHEKAYTCIERIYSVMTENSTIENIFIDGNCFSVEVTTKDAMKILSSFEYSEAFYSVKMNKTTVKDKVETVTYNGNFSRFWKDVDESLSVDEKINFYKTEIECIKVREEKKHDVQLSEYIKNIRALLRMNECNEQYIQIKGKENNAEVEFFILSTSRNILNFLKEIQQEDTNNIEIKQLRIRNSEERNRIQTTICFDSGIEIANEDKTFEEYIDKKIEPAEIDKIFYKSQTQKTRVQKSKTQEAVTKQTVSVLEQKAPVQLQKLTYIGRTRINNQDFIIAKEEEMGSIYKLLLTENELDENTCVIVEGGYKAKVNGNYYEVKK